MGKASTLSECCMIPPPDSAGSGRSHRRRRDEKETSEPISLVHACRKWRA